MHTDGLQHLNRNEWHANSIELGERLMNGAIVHPTGSGAPVRRCSGSDNIISDPKHQTTYRDDFQSISYVRVRIHCDRNTFTACSTQKRDLLIANRDAQSNQLEEFFARALGCRLRTHACRSTYCKGWPSIDTHRGNKWVTNLEPRPMVIDKVR